MTLQSIFSKSIIYLSRVLCLSVCDCVCVSQFVSERSINQTDQGDENEGLKREGLKRERWERDR
jgi:hypothetical protein